jgi:hypothetical protein
MSDSSGHHVMASIWHDGTALAMTNLRLHLEPQSRTAGNPSSAEQTGIRGDGCCSVGLSCLLSAGYELRSTLISCLGFLLHTEGKVTKRLVIPPT